MIHLYHGLFGSKEDWDEIIDPSQPCLKHDLYREPISQLLSLKTTSEDILVGYSMGGRIALEIAFRNSFLLKKIVLISTHPGLELHEIPERKVFEAKTLEKMKSLSVEQFADYWNLLPLFKSSKLQSSLDTVLLEKSATLFEHFKLSEYSRPSNQLKEHRSKIIWITGSEDEKYRNIVRDRVQPLGIITFETLTDHRALRDPEKIRSILLSEGIL